MPITVDTLGKIRRDQTENSCLFFVNVLLSPSLYMLIQFLECSPPCFACRQIFYHYSPRFQRIIVNCQSVANLVFDVVNENCPRNIRQLLLSIKDIHSYETRSAANGKLYTRPSSLKTQLNSFSRSGTRFWHSLPKSVKDSPKFSFKKRYEMLFSLCSNKKRTILNSKELHRSL